MSNPNNEMNEFRIKELADELAESRRESAEVKLQLQRVKDENLGLKRAAKAAQEERRKKLEKVLKDVEKLNRDMEDILTMTILIKSRYEATEKLVVGLEAFIATINNPNPSHSSPGHIAAAVGVPETMNSAIVDLDSD